MGKKSRLAGGAVGRRTILQLSPPGNRGGNVGEREEAPSGSDGLSLLGAYEDSDEEDPGDSHRSAAISQHNQSGDIDSTLANFMAEIDAITTQPSSDDAPSHQTVPNDAPPRPEVNTQQPAAGEGQNQQSTDFEYNTQYSLAGGVEMGDWQEVWDENSGCYYYWNTLTNEVSWELPHYLADQVQSLGSSVNGNGTAHAGYYTEENTVSAATTTSAKETKAKEVIESVVGLTSEEEERQGVAAALLAPLIPTEVKESEEKWRKRLLKGLDESENSLDSDAEGIRLAESPSTPVRDSDSAPTVQKDVCIKKQSGDNSEGEEETEEDTMELELALERKKAELRALEEGDVSAGGSSPCSENSQEASGPRGVLQKKNRWKTSFLSAASPDSNSRGSFQIGELANTLISKMEFLGINKKGISNFQLLLLQTETRVADWREGALNGVYLRRRLQEAAEHIKYYELNATPKGWSCHWDEHRRYFYVKDRTGASQWDFPTEEDKEEDLKDGQSTQTQTSSQGDAKTSVSAAGAVESAGALGKGQKRKAGQMNKAITIGSSPILYTQPAASAPLMSAAAYWGMPAVTAPLVPCEPPAPPVPALPPQPPLPPSLPPFEPPGAKALPTDKSKKTKKDKPKKSKTKMPSLVKKWQSIQKELDEEEKSSSSDDDRDLLNKKSIEDWKQQQLVGKASKNANFEALPEDWRERLKKRKLMNST
uniref:Formin binding protein 4 n=1 Tax=Amphilophus citrinellus TaxID=61819 RepID=A0A3Q0SYX9_AMPCI